MLDTPDTYVLLGASRCMHVFHPDALILIGPPRSPQHHTYAARLPPWPCVSQPSKAVNYIIALVGDYPSRSRRDSEDAHPRSRRSTLPFIGQMQYAGFNFAPRGWAKCDGQLLAISTNTALFSLIGTYYGGDGRSTFGLPDLRGRVPVHAGTGPSLSNVRVGDRGGTQNPTLTSSNLPPHTHGTIVPHPDVSWRRRRLLSVDTSPIVALAGGQQPFSIDQPSLSLTPVIALQGQFPSRSRRDVPAKAGSSNSTAPSPEPSTAGVAESAERSRSRRSSDPFIGEIKAYGFNFAPRGWAKCDGQLLAISTNTALFSLIGTYYGGDGRSTFGLPDLRGRVPVHAGTGPGLSTRRLGASFGGPSVTLTSQHLPTHDHTVSFHTNATAARFCDNATTDSYTVMDAGGGQPASIMQPYLAVTYVIALSGTYPSRSRRDAGVSAPGKGKPAQSIHGVPSMHGVPAQSAKAAEFTQAAEGTHQDVSAGADGPEPLGQPAHLLRPDRPVAPDVPSRERRDGIVADWNTRRTCEYFDCGARDPVLPPPAPPAGQVDAHEGYQVCDGLCCTVDECCWAAPSSTPSSSPSAGPSTAAPSSDPSSSPSAGPSTAPPSAGPTTAPSLFSIATAPNNIGPIECGSTVGGNTAAHALNDLGNAAHDHWYTFTVTTTSMDTFDSCGSLFDTWLRVYRLDSSGGYVEVASCDDCGDCHFQTILTTDWLRPGDYALLVEGYSTRSGNYTVAMTCLLPGAPTTSPTLQPTSPTSSPTASPAADCPQLLASDSGCSGCKKDLYSGLYVGCTGGSYIAFPTQRDVTFESCKEQCRSEPGCNFFSHVLFSRTVGICNLHIVPSCTVVPQGASMAVYQPQTCAPTAAPASSGPTRTPMTSFPTDAPSRSPSTRSPTRDPTTASPTALPTRSPTTPFPTDSPTYSPSTRSLTRHPTSSSPTAPPTPPPTPSPTIGFLGRNGRGDVLLDAPAGGTVMINGVPVLAIMAGIGEWLDANVPSAAPGQHGPTGVPTAPPATTAPQAAAVVRRDGDDLRISSATGCRVVLHGVGIADEIGRLQALVAQWSQLDPRPASYRPGATTAFGAANLHIESGPETPFVGRHTVDMFLNATRQGSVFLNGIDIVASVVALEQSLL